MLAKKFYNLKDFGKIYKILVVVGVILSCFSVYYIFKNKYPAFFMLISIGIVLLLVGTYSIYKEKKQGRLTPYQFVCIINTGGCFIFLSWSVCFFFYGQPVYGIVFLVASILYAVIVYLKKYVNKVGEDRVIELLNKYDKK